MVKQKGKFTEITLEKKVLVEGKILPEGTVLLVEQDGIIDSVSMPSNTDPSYDEVYDKATMNMKQRIQRLRRMGMEVEPGEEVVLPTEGVVEVPLEQTPTVEVEQEDGDIEITLEDMMTPEERFEMKRRKSRMMNMCKSKMDDEESTLITEKAKIQQRVARIKELSKKNSK